MSFNKVILMGNITRDPELKFTPSGKPFCEIGVACNEQWTDASGEKKEKVDFFGVVFWGRTAESVVKYFTKGKPILIEGKLSQDRWEKDGKTETKTKVIGETWRFAGGTRTETNDEAPPRPQRPAQPAPPAAEPDDDDIPF